MSRTLSAALCSRRNSWVLGVGLAVALTAGCGSQGDSGEDDNGGGNGVSTGGGYAISQGGSVLRTGGATGIIILTGQGGNVVGQGGNATGGRIIITVGGNNPNTSQGGFAPTVGGFAPTGGVSVVSTCTTGTLNCACYSSGACSAGLQCNTSTNKCVRDTTVTTGGAAATGGSMSTGGAPSTAAGGTNATGGSSGPAGGVTSTSATAGGTTATAATATGGGISFITGGAAPTGGATATTGGATDATGGATSETTGGATAATGGATSETTGGATAATGGATPTTGGAAPTGGATGTGGSTSVATCSDPSVINNPNGVIVCTADCSISGPITAGTVAYDCKCTSGHLACVASSTTNSACPAGVTNHTTADPVACNPSIDTAPCKLDVKVNATTTQTHTCSCDTVANVWFGASNVCYF